MTNIIEIIEQIENNLSVTYFFNQLITILCLILYGSFFLLILSDDDSEHGKIIKLLLAYPAGLAVFSIVAYVMVTFFIPYNSLSVVIACILVAVVVAVISEACGQGKTIVKLKAFLSGVLSKRGIIAAVFIVLAAVAACSGILSVTVSNDSMYNYSFYPRAIVLFGGLRVNFDMFLTDVGQGCALINTLPFLYNFNETFGIQHMLNICFVGLFYVKVGEIFNSYTKVFRILFAAIVSLLLVFSLPFMLMSKWILANEYFAVFMFITLILSEKRSGGGNVALISIFIAALSIMRIEGGVFAVLLIMCISTLDYSNKELGLCMLLPTIILHSSYSARIFLTMDITAPYKFLTPNKALLMILFMVMALIYLLFIRGRFFNKLLSHLDILIIGGLVLLNLLLFIKKPSVYIENLKVFLINVMYNGGWGIFPVIVFSIYLICLFDKIRFGYRDLMAFAYLLYTLAVSFMRDDVLTVGVGDSGNRVLLQVVPILLFTAVSHIPKNEKTV